MWERNGTHQLELVTVTYRSLPGGSGPSTAGEFTLSSTCRCGVMSVYTWTCVPQSGAQLEDKVLGLIQEVSAVAGPPVHQLRSRASSSD
jgi:hypothetical protein